MTCSESWVCTVSSPDNYNWVTALLDDNPGQVAVQYEFVELSSNDILDQGISALEYDSSTETASFTATLGPNNSVSGNISYALL